MGLVLPCCDGPDTAGERPYALLIHVAAAPARRDPIRHQPRPAPHMEALAGKAGVPKEIRDRIQNHALQDVSSKSYDRWTYLPEKRAGMAQWNTFVTSLLQKPGLTIAA